MDEDDMWWEGALALVAGSGGAAVGAPAMRLAGWLQTRDELTGRDPRRVIARAVRQGFVVTRDEAMRLGVSRAELRSRIRRGEWTSPRYGVICPLPGRAGHRPHGASPEIAVAAAARSRAGTVVSHESAAILHALPTLVTPERPVLTVARASDGGGWKDCLVRACPIHASERSDWFGVPVTTVARTVVDIARAGGAAAGLVTADAALHEGLVRRDELVASVRRAPRRPGVRAARRVVELADARAESPLESITRLCVVEGGLPVFEPQVAIPTARGVYRVDLLCRSYRVVIEADGLRKYRRGPDVLTMEKLRQEAIERAGYRVVRVTWDDVTREKESTLARIRRAFPHSCNEMPMITHKSGASRYKSRI